MDNSSLGAIAGSIVVLLILSGYFSASETALMAIDRHRLRHLVRQKRRSAILTSRLLSRPDRLLGLILIGNNLVNFIAASLATVIGLRLLGDASGPAVTAVTLTIVFLVFAEVTPKTIAAHFPERVSFFSVYILSTLLYLLSPAVWVLNHVCNLLARPFGVRVGNLRGQRLSREELRTVMHESAAIERRSQDMMLGVLNLDKTMVRDIMIPRNEIHAIDCAADVEEIVKTLCTTKHTRLPVFEGSLDQVHGILHTRNAGKFLIAEKRSKETLIKLLDKPYFIPEGTPLQNQMLQFQAHRQRMGMVVDEYGDVLGITTLEDILEEIVGDFTTDTIVNIQSITPQKDGSYEINGAAPIRAVNKRLQWSLPTDGPRTIHGLIVERLEMIPQHLVCLQVGSYQIETLALSENRVGLVKISAKSQPPDHAEA